MSAARLKAWLHALIKRPILRSTFSRALTAIIAVQLITVALATVVVVPVAYEARINLVAGLLDGVLSGVKMSEGIHPVEERMKRLQAAGFELREERPPGSYLRGSPLEFIVEQAEDSVGLKIQATVLFERRGPGNLVFWVRRPDLLEGRWIGVRRSQNPLNILQSLTLWGGLTLLFSAVTAVLFSLTVSRPLRSLARAAEIAARVGEPLQWRPSGAAEIRHLGAILEQAHSRLDRQYREQQLILAAASHDMRTPLSRLRLAVDLLPPSEQALVLDMSRAIEEIDEQIGEFLKMLGLGAQEPMIDLDLVPVLRSLCRRYSGAGVEVTYLGPDVLRLRLRARAVQWVLRALVQNAVEHGHAPVLIALQPEHGQVRIRIRDHGAGVAEERLAELGRHTAGRSRGHGLAVSRRLIESMGGVIEFANADPGLAVEVRLPLPGI